MEIRPYEPCWRDLAARLWWESSAALRDEGSPSAKDLAQRLDAEIKAGWVVWLVWDRAAPIAFLAIAPHEPRLCQLFVAVDRQCMGVGAQLIAHTKRVLARGFTLWTHPTNAGAIRFYQRHGLAKSGEFVDADGRHRLIYAWRPSPPRGEGRLRASRMRSRTRLGVLSTSWFRKRRTR